MLEGEILSKGKEAGCVYKYYLAIPCLPTEHRDLGPFLKTKKADLIDPLCYSEEFARRESEINDET
jgi:hypothetical protein